MLARLGIVLALIVAALVILALDGRSEGRPPASPTPTATTTATATIAATATTARLPPPATPAATRVPFTSEPGVYFVSADGATLRRIIEGEVYTADLSPDGTEVIYSSADGSEVLATGVATGETRTVVGRPVPGHILSPSWSATGKYVVFLMDEDGTGKGTWLMMRDGSGLRRISEDDRAFYISDWLPDDSAAVAISDRLVVYGEGPDLPPWHLFLVAPGGELQGPFGEYQVCYCGGGGRSPIMSPDGSRIAFSDDTGDVYVINTDGSDRHAVTTGEDYDWLVGWSNGGEGLIYRTFGGGTWPGESTLYFQDLASGAREEISGYARDHAPDAATIAGDFSSPCGALLTDIVLETGEGDPRNLTKGRIPGRWFMNSAQWLPDGSGLVFTASPTKPCT